MNRITKALAVMALVLAAGGAVFAADQADVDRQKRDARVVGRQYAEQGMDIADDAVDFANRVADNFADAYEDTKDDARDYLDE